MPTIDVPVATYERLTRRAAALSTSVEALAVPALEKAANEPIPAAVEPLPMPPTPPGQLPYDEWKKVIDEMLARAEIRRHLYPPGFEADVSRESIYEGCGE